MGDFPNDADGDVLRRLDDKGFDFSKPALVYFYCYASGSRVANEISELMRHVGFNAEVFEDDDSTSVYFSKEMLLTYSAVIAEQEMADKRLVAYGTYCDGWMVGMSPNGQNERKLT